MKHSNSLLAIIGLAIAGYCSAGDIVVSVDSTAQDVTVDSPAGRVNGNCTLGEAILAVNSGGIVDGCDATARPGERVRVALQGQQFNLTQPAVILDGNPPQIAASGLPVITANIILDGAGATVVRDTSPGTPGFNLINFNDPTLLIDLRNLTLEGAQRRLGFSAPAMVDGTADIVSFDSVVMQNFSGEAFNISVATAAVADGLQILGGGNRKALGGDIQAESNTSPSITVSNSVFSGVLFSTLDIRLQRSGVDNVAIDVSNSTFSDGFGTAGAGLDIDVNADGADIQINGSTFSGNVAGTAGGGLRVVLRDNVAGATAQISLRGNRFTGNQAPDEGGGFLLDGNLTPVQLSIVDDLYSGNYAREGGGLYLEALTAATAQINNTTFDDNVASLGGAVLQRLTDASAGSPSLRISRSAFLNNFDYLDGAVIGLFNGTEATIIDNSTIHGNVSTDDLFAFLGNDIDLTLEAVTMDNNSGRELVDLSAPSTLTLRNVVSTGNPNGFVCDSDTAAAVIDAGGNHFTTDECTGVALGDPMLGPLQENGGTTLNQLPVAGSPLIDMGVAPAVEPSVDQRGLPRVINSAPDIGAVETGAIVIFQSSFEGN